MPLSPDDFIAELWTIARQVPMIEHPWFKGIIEHRWTHGQIVLGEVQHYLRVRTNPIFFGYIAVNAVSEKQYELMVGGCQRRSALEGLALLSFVEDQHGGASGVAAQVYRSLIGHYGFSPRAAETYHIHAEQDEGHGGRQIDAIRRFAVTDSLQEKVRQAVQLGVNAFNFEWDGHVQAMTGVREHWAGVGALALRQPTGVGHKPSLR